LKRNNSY